MTMKSVHGITIGFDDHGSGTPVVLVHGHPFNRSMWSEQVAALSPTCRVITPDLRGYGETTITPGKVTLEDMARDIAALLDALDIDRVIIGGLSMGGQIVFEFFHQFPSRVRALILADTQAQAETEQGRVVRYETAQRVVDSGMQSLASEMLPKLLAAKTFADHPNVVEHVRHMIMHTNPEGAAAALRGRAERRDYVPLLPEITVPTLVVVGSEDTYTPISDAQLMHQGIAGSQLVIHEGIGHIPNMERPGEFNAALIQFLRPILSSQAV